MQGKTQYLSRNFASAAVNFMKYENEFMRVGTECCCTQYFYSITCFVVSVLHIVDKMTTTKCNYLCIVNNTDDKTFDVSTLKPNFDEYVLSVLRIAAFICIFGYFGNFLLIFSTWRKGSSLHSKSNHLIAHLAVADILACTVHVQV
jgi:hypothetical protein